MTCTGLPVVQASETMFTLSQVTMSTLLERDTTGVKLLQIFGNGTYISMIPARLRRISASTSGA